MAENEKQVTTENTQKETSRRPPRGDRRGRGDRRQNRRQDTVKEFEERTVSIKRVTKVVKGGKHMRFTALVVVGNGKGIYGFGKGKAGEVPDAIKKAIDTARKNTAKIEFVGSDTIAHEVIGKFGACNVFLKPAPAGTGVIAGGSVRAVLELAGIKNCYSKVYGSRSPINVIRATHQGLQNLKTYEQLQRLRGRIQKVQEDE